jgi:2-polyprenyl-3-methyl-5-hydroxy-6-metoxy-1,4-benzoquinol methylase
MKGKLVCPICSTPVLLSVLTHGKCSIYSCSICSLEFLSPRPTLKELKLFYQKNYFTGKHSGVSGYRDYLSIVPELDKEAKKRIRYIKKFSRKKLLLDVGAGTGVFLKVAQKYGYNVSGNDISNYAVKHLNKSGFKTCPGPINTKTIPKNRYDIVTAWDVIEHLPNLKEAVQAIYDSLLPGGYFFLTTPDNQSIDAKIMQKKWYGYKKIPEHLWYFNESSISYLLSQVGFKSIKTHPWGFYRSLGFIAHKLQIYTPYAKYLMKILQTTKLAKISFYCPLTDFMVVAQKDKK